MKRKRRKGEVTCRCGAYKFPHRMMGGQCEGGAFVAKLFADQVWGSCRDCILRVEPEDGGEIHCQVLSGQEPSVRCPELIDFIRYESIKLYGINKPPEKKVSLRFRR